MGSTTVGGGGYYLKKIKTFVSWGKELFYEGYSIFLSNAKGKKNQNELSGNKMLKINAVCSADRREQRQSGYRVQHGGARNI